VASLPPPLQQELRINMQALLMQELRIADSIDVQLHVIEPSPNGLSRAFDFPEDQSL